MRIHKSATLFGAAALLLSAGGCGKSERRGGAAKSREADIASIKATIAADVDQWNEDYGARAKDVDRFMAHYAPEPYVVPAGLNPIGGEWNLRSLFRTIANDPNFAMTLAADRIEVSGNLAFARGHYADRYTDPRTNQLRSEAGTFLMIYKKQDDGSWKIIEDFSAPYTSPQPPPK